MNKFDKIEHAEMKVLEKYTDEELLIEQRRRAQARIDARKERARQHRVAVTQVVDILLGLASPCTINDSEYGCTHCQLLLIKSQGFVDKSWHVEIKVVEGDLI